MKIRQAVISLQKPVDDETHDEYSPYDIQFMQSYHDAGINFHFEFTKAIFNPSSMCNIAIENFPRSMLDYLTFDRFKPNQRPKIDIYAGYTDPLKTTAELKVALPKIYSGYPSYYAGQKNIGSKTLFIQCSDLLAAGNAERFTGLYHKGEPIINALEDLTTQLGYSGDFSGMNAAQNFSEDFYINGRFIMSDVLPKLCKDYGIFYNIKNDNDSMDGKPSMLFISSDQTIIESISVDVSNENGMIEYPQPENFGQYNFRTLFGLPQMFFVGNWINLIDKRRSVFDTGNFKGVVVSAKYQWGEQAEIQYLLSEDFAAIVPRLQY